MLWKSELETENTIVAYPQNCTSCRRCQLICSFLKKGEFNISDADIAILEKDDKIEKIVFSDDCRKCGSCVSYCVYGALKFKGARS